MKTFSLSPVIHVSDLCSSINYYVDVLGFKPDFEFGDYAGLTYDDISIQLSGPTSGGLKKTVGQAHFCIDCDEVDNYYNSILKNGALITARIADRVYGVRDFAVDDLDGNTLVFGKAIE